MAAEWRINMKCIINDSYKISAKNNSTVQNGSFIALLNGDLMFAYIEKSQNGTDIITVTTSDSGNTWSAPSVLYHSDKQLDGLSLLRMKNGDIGVFFTEEVTADWTYITVMLRSNDEEKMVYFRTEECSYDLYNGYFILQNDSVLMTENQKIIIPMTYRTGAFKDNGCARADIREFAIFSCSTDDGETWVSSPDDLYPTFSSTQTGLRHLEVVEIVPDVLKASLATDMMCQYFSLSTDAGEFWTPAEPSRFSSACSPMKTIKSTDGNFYSVWNPTPNYLGRTNTEGNLGLSPISISLLSEDTLRPEVPTVIDESDDVPLHSPAGIFLSDEELVVSYTAGNEIKIKKILIEKR